MGGCVIDGILTWANVFLFFSYIYIYFNCSPSIFFCSKSFVLSTFGFTAVAFVTGSLALWAPAFLYRAAVFTGERQPCVKQGCGTSDRLHTHTHREHPVTLMHASNTSVSLSSFMDTKAFSL